MRKLSLLFFFLAYAGPAHARLGLPLVDLPAQVRMNLTGVAASIAIWSATDVTMNAGDTLTVHFPIGWLTRTAALNMATCNCIFAKFNMTGTASFTAREVTVTSGMVVTWTAGIDMPGDLIMNLPASFVPGPFYVRIDNGTGYKNPVTRGAATLSLSYSYPFYNGSVTTTVTTTTESRPVTIIDWWVPPAPTPAPFFPPPPPGPGLISGRVKYNPVAGQSSPIPGALVIADTDTNDTFINALPLWNQGPTALPVSPKAVTHNRFSTVTGVDGRFSLQVPFRVSTLYRVAAFYSTRTTGVTTTVVNMCSAIYNATVNASAPAAVDLTVTTFNPTTNN